MKNTLRRGDEVGLLRNKEKNQSHGELNRGSEINKEKIKASHLD